MQEVVRGDYLGRTRIALDYFDASINRVAAWVIGTRATQKALLQALLEPWKLLRQQEENGDFTARLATLEDFKTMHVGGVWDYYCARNGVPLDNFWLDEVRRYEQVILRQRD